MEKNTGQREIRPVWNSAQRINHQNKFVPSAVLTRLGRVPVSAAKQSSPRATTSTSTFRPVNTATHTNRVNVSELRTNSFYKSHSPIRRANPQPALKNKGIILTVDVQHITGTKTSLMTIKTLMEVSLPLNLSGKTTRASSTNSFNTVSTPVNAAGAPRTSNDAGLSFVPLGRSFPDDPLMPDLEDTAEADFNNKEPSLLIEAIKLFLAYASFMNFLVYQMDVKSAFLYGTIEEEVIGQTEKTLFLKRVKSDILLVQVYVDDIIFCSTKKYLCIDFEQIMHKRFQMSSMGELTFFLGLQVKQKEDGIFISQDKYVGEILKKFGFSSIRTANTPMETNKALTKDEDGVDVDIHLYNSMIGSLMYLTSSIPDIMLISWQCKKQTVVANSTTKAEYIAASHYCGQVL
ncbi:copia protein [Tanacetum coccineum]